MAQRRDQAIRYRADLWDDPVLTRAYPVALELRIRAFPSGVPYVSDLRLSVHSRGGVAAAAAGVVGEGAGAAVHDDGVPAAVTPALVSVVARSLNRLIDEAMAAHALSVELSRGGGVVVSRDKDGSTLVLDGGELVSIGADGSERWRQDAHEGDFVWAAQHRAAAERRRRVSRRVATDAEIRKAAEAYKAAEAVNQPVTKAVMDAVHVGRSRAGDYIRMAKAKGYLDYTPRGRRPKR